MKLCVVVLFALVQKQLERMQRSTDTYKIQKVLVKSYGGFIVLMSLHISYIISCTPKMALRVAVCVTTLLLIAVVQIKKCTFCSGDSFNLIANHAGPVYEIQDSYIFSSLWQNRKSSGILLRPTRSAIERLIGLLLICGDIESCPGPTIKCSSCAQTIRKNQSRI